MRRDVLPASVPDCAVSSSSANRTLRAAVSKPKCERKERERERRGEMWRERERTPLQWPRGIGTGVGPFGAAAGVAQLLLQKGNGNGRRRARRMLRTHRGRAQRTACTEPLLRFVGDDEGPAVGYD